MKVAIDTVYDLSSIARFCCFASILQERMLESLSGQDTLLWIDMQHFL